MKKSLHSLLSDYSITKQSNSFFYFLSHNFIFKHFFYDDMPAEYLAKEGINLTFRSVNVLFAILKKVIYFAIFVGVCQNYNFLITFMIASLIGTILKGIFLYNETDYDAIILLKANPTSYGKYRINNYLIREFVYCGFAISIVAVNLEFNYFWCLYTVIIYLAIHLIGQCVAVIIAQYNKLTIKDYSIVKLVFIIISAIIMIGIVVLDIAISNTLCSIFGLVLIVVAILCYIYLMHFNEYEVLFKYNLSIHLGEHKKAESSTIIEGVDYRKINNKIDATKSSNKKGYDYLFEMFLNRYHKVLNRRVVSTSIIISVLGLALVYLPTFTTDIIPFDDSVITPLDIFDFGEIIYYSLPSIMIVMYFICSNIGKKFVQLCFFQLDRYLVNYSFYRTKESVMKNLSMRIKYVIIQNGIPAALVSLFLSVAFIRYSYEINYYQLAIIIIFPLLLSLFFSIFTITMYYIFQPYSFDGSVVNKTYPTIDRIIYVVTYFLPDVIFELNIIVVLIFIIILSAITIYMYKLVIRKAPQEFRVR